MARSYGKRFVPTISVAILGVICAFSPAGLLLPADASTKLTFCILVPHFKDEYWLSVGYGLEQEASKRGIDLEIYEAGGYRSRERQITQLRMCGDRQVDAILLGAVTSDHPDLLSAISEISLDVPIYSLVNELHAPELGASIGVDWEEMGVVLGRFLAARHPAGSPKKTAVLISGPPESGWIGPLEDGLRSSISGSSLHLAAVFGADTGARQQLVSVEEAFARFPDLDYLIGSAPAIEAAVGLLERTDFPPRPVLVSTYISHTVKRGLMNGRVLAVPFDDPMMQGKMAIMAAVGELPIERASEFVGPEIILLTPDPSTFDRIQLSPSEYFPAID